MKTKQDIIVSILPTILNNFDVIEYKFIGNGKCLQIKLSNNKKYLIAIQDDNSLPYRKKRIL